MTNWTAIALVAILTAVLLWAWQKTPVGGKVPATLLSDMVALHNVSQRESWQES
jgi:hypothetical protein